ncbi:MAG: hypothetical protein F7C81_05470 [Desulfurococcales archaeon]|nr:hypothetical protein [Desulfurococcales archaeon]
MDSRLHRLDDWLYRDVYREVYESIVYYAYHRGEYVTIYTEEIAEHAGVDPRVAMRILQQLNRKGVIARRRCKRRYGCWYVTKPYYIIASMLDIDYDPMAEEAILLGNR